MSDLLAVIYEVIYERKHTGNDKPRCYAPDDYFIEGVTVETMQDQFEAARPIPKGVRRNEIGSYAPETFADTIGVQLAISYSREWEAWQAACARWQPIETAPSDLSDVLLFSDDDSGEKTISIGFFCEAGIWIDSTSGDEVFNVTHWMPLPAPPAGA